VWVRGILQEAAQTAKRHPMFANAYAQLARRRGKNIATVAIARRLLARCFHILTQLEVPPESPEKAGTGRARVSAWACNTAVDLTEQPGPDAIVMRTPPSGPEWVHASHLRNAVRAFSSPQSCAGPGRGQGRSSSGALHPAPGCGPAYSADTRSQPTHSPPGEGRSLTPP
jgi:hypothetical protein